MKFHYLGIIPVAMIAFLSSASAQQLGVNFTSPGTVGNNYDFDIGYEFQVTSPVTVTALAAYLPEGTAQSQDIPIDLWSDGGALIASATVTAGTGPSLGDFATANIAPLTLGDGFYDVAAVDPYAFGNDGYGTITGVTYAPGITFVEDRYSAGGTVAFPNESEFHGGGGFIGFFGGNIVVNGASAPDASSSLVLIGVALGALAAFRRKFVFSA
jgi:hypothetical protein